MRSRSLLLSLILVGISMPTSSSLLHAQAAIGGGTFVGVPESFPDIEARAMVVREPGIDLVLLREDNVSVDALMMALVVLEQVRSRHPAPEHGQMVPITGYVVTVPPSGGQLHLLQRTLERLELAEPTNLGSLGPGRRVRLQGR